VKVLHTSDWHLGRTLFQTSLLDDQRTFLEWLLGQAHAHQVSAVLVSGDVYDRAVPSVDAVTLLDDTVAAFSRAGVPLVLVSGNHDSAIRLGFGSGLAERAGVHLRTTLADIDRPVELRDEHGTVAVYGIPYLLPDSVKDELGAERTHESVLRAAVARSLADAARRGITRTVVLAHAFITGGVATESERDIKVGGLQDAPAGVFDGATYVALGHLHRPQHVPLPGSGTVLRYSGSPLAFSFSEKDDAKSVTLVELDAHGITGLSEVLVPVPRSLREVSGRLDDLLADRDDDAELAEAWVKVTLTNPSRPSSPMERLRAKWPFTLALEFAPDGEHISSADDIARLRATNDPIEICSMFVEYVDHVPPTEPEQAVLTRAIEMVRDTEVAAG